MGLRINRLVICFVFTFALGGCEQAIDAPLQATSSESPLTDQQPSVSRDTEETEPVQDDYVDLRRALRSEKYEAVLNRLSEEELAKSSDPAVLSAVGLATLATGDLPSARQLLNRAIEIDSTCSMALLLKARLEFLDSDIDAGKATLDRISDPLYAADVYLLRASLALAGLGEASGPMEGMRQLLNAERWLEKSLYVDKQFAAAYKLRAFLQVMLQNSEVLGELEATVRRERLQAALTDIQRAMEINPDINKGYFIRASITQALTDADPEACVSDWANALQQDPLGRPFLPRLVQCLFFSQVTSKPELLKQVHSALGALDEQGQRELLDVFMRADLLVSEQIAVLEKQQQAGELPEEKLQVLGRVKRDRDAATQFVLQLRNAAWGQLGK